MPRSLPSRPPSLIEHTVEVLREAVVKGTWVGSLPGERELSQVLQVSRPTLRAALVTLEREGWVAVKQGMRRVILRGALPVDSGAGGVGRVVGLLSSVPLHEIVPHAQAWTDRFREVLAKEGYELQVHCGRRWYGQSPERALATLTHQAPAAVWALFVAPAAMQRWFEGSKLGCVVSGSLHPGVRLPSVDFDHRATSRHAAGRLAALGHRTLVFLRQGSTSAGDVESAMGFYEGIEGAAGVTVEVADHDGTPEGIRRAVAALVRRSPKPTGFLVARAHAALRVASELAQRGVRIPQDASVICRDSDDFLEYLSPALACYKLDPKTHAQRLANVLLQVGHHGLRGAPQVRLMPTFDPGESVGRAG